MNRKLVAISSPLQLLNAQEAILHYGSEGDENHLIVRSLLGGRNERLIREILEQDLWSSVYWYHSKHKILQLPQVLKRYKGSQWDYVMSGELTAWWYNRLLANVSFKRQIVFDDGTMTVEDHKNFLVNGNLPDKNKGLKDALLRMLGFSTTPRKIDTKQPVELFTIFDLPDTAYCRVTSNEMKRLQSRLSHAGFYAQSGSVLFIGQPLLDLQAISWETFERHLLQAQDAAASGRLLYFAHRNETQPHLEKIARLPNVEVITPDKPIELALCNLQESISMAVGFSSTALITLDRFFQQLPVFRMRIPDDEFLSDEQRDISISLHHYMENGIRLFPGQ